MPATASRSLIACGKPCSGPRQTPRASSSSRSRASASSASRSRSATIAFTFGFKRAIRSSVSVITSTHETRRARIAAASSTALVDHSVSTVGVTGFFAARTSSSRCSTAAKISGCAANT